MATYKPRGNTHSIIYPYWAEDGSYKQQWETYTTELEAVQRKAYIDFLQKNRKRPELLQAVLDYKKRRDDERKAQEPVTAVSEAEISVVAAEEDNTGKTYREFAEKWLPFRARKKRFSPNTYDSYVSNLNLHILPYFGDWVMSTIKAEDIDNFLDHLSQPPVYGGQLLVGNPGGPHADGRLGNGPQLGIHFLKLHIFLFCLRRFSLFRSAFSLLPSAGGRTFFPLCHPERSRGISSPSRG